MKKIAILMLSLILALTLLVSCGCSEHIDEVRDGKCDNCGAEVELNCDEGHTDGDKDNICDICKKVLIGGSTETVVNVTFTLVDQDGAVLPGVRVSFFKGSATTPAYTATSGEDGRFTMDIMTGLYNVDYEYDGYYQALTRSISILETTKNANLSFNNTTPNGTETRPYPLLVDANSYSLAAGEKSYFIVYRAIDLIAEIEGAGIKVSYGENTYTPDADGNISFALVGEDTNSTATLIIENTGAEAADIVITINSLPGTQGNPHILTALGTPVTAEGITKDDIVYYQYTATEDGTLTLTLEGVNSFAQMQNTRNSVVSSTGEAGSRTISLDVKAGDVILINVSATVDDAIDVVFSMELQPE